MPIGLAFIYERTDSIDIPFSVSPNSILQTLYNTTK